MLSYDISAYLFLFLHLFNISVHLFSILLFLCKTIFSFSFNRNEHLLLLVLYAWCLPKISHVIFALCLLSFILQNSLESSVSDLRFLWLNDFLWFAYLSLNVVLQYHGKLCFLSSHLTGLCLLGIRCYCWDTFAVGDIVMYWCSCKFFYQ